MRSSRRWLELWGSSLALGALACAGYGDALARGQRYYEDNQYERALALWRDLDRRGAAFSPAERTRYAYFRGMTDYRLGYRDDARHWLGVAQARDGASAGVLGAAWRERLESALADLEHETFGSRRIGGDVVQTIEWTPSAATPAEAEGQPDAGDAASRPGPASH